MDFCNLDRIEMATWVVRMELSPASATTVHWWPGGVASLRSFNVLAHDAPGPGDDA